MATFTATAQVVTWASTEDPRVVFRFVSASGESSGDGISQAQGDARYLQQSNDLSDLDDAATARGHLGLGSAATSDAEDFATAAQGAAADTAVQPGDLGSAAASDIGDFDAAGAAASAQSAAQGYADGLVDDLSGVSDAATARANLGLGTAAEADIGTGSGDVAAGDAPATATNNVVAATGSTETLAFATDPDSIVHDVTMDEDCTFSFSGAPSSGTTGSMTVIVRGAFTPTLPASVDWAGGSAPTYASPSVYEFVTVDGGTTVLGFAAGLGLA